MKYFKILQDKLFIGAVHSGQFVTENAAHKLRYSDELKGQYVSYEGKLYRSPWMVPTVSSRAYEEAQIEEISAEEYDRIMAAIHNNEDIIIDDDDYEEPIPDPVEPIPDITTEYVREGKIKEMSTMCRRTIENGFDLNLRGETHHFSLSTQDQLNLMNLSIMAYTKNLIPYHADGEECVFYTAEEINAIVDAANTFKMYHTTYYNALKTYINALNTIEDISAITYGIPIPEEYKSDVLMVLE